MNFRVNNFSNLFCSSCVQGSGIDSVRKSIGYSACAFIIFLLLNIPLYAQDWRWPEKPENLQVLGEEFTGRRLGGMMRGFIIGLGVRCEHCHVGKAGQPLSSFDFPSDKNPNKNRAREMLRMVDDIKGHLAKIDPSGSSRVEISCNTCHRGLSRPISLSAQLGDTFRSDGLDVQQFHLYLEHQF